MGHSFDPSSAANTSPANPFPDVHFPAECFSVIYFYLWLLITLFGRRFPTPRPFPRLPTITRLTLCGFVVGLLLRYPLINFRSNCMLLWWCSPVPSPPSLPPVTCLLITRLFSGCLTIDTMFLCLKLIIWLDYIDGDKNLDLVCWVLVVMAVFFSITFKLFIFTVFLLKFINLSSFVVMADFFSITFKLFIFTIFLLKFINLLSYESLINYPNKSLRVACPLMLSHNVFWCPVKGVLSLNLLNNYQNKALRVSCPLTCGFVSFTWFGGFVSLSQLSNFILFSWVEGVLFLNNYEIVFVLINGVEGVMSLYKKNLYLKATTGLVCAAPDRRLDSKFSTFRCVLIRCDSVCWTGGRGDLSTGFRGFIPIASWLCHLAFLISFLCPCGVSGSCWCGPLAFYVCLHDDRRDNKKVDDLFFQMAVLRQHCLATQLCCFLSLFVNYFVIRALDANILLQNM